MSTPSKVQLDHRYQLEDRVAAGGYGEVWRATDLVLGRPVAVKLLLAQHVQQAETLARFRAEAQRAGALAQQNIARVYDYVEPRPPQPPFLVMELIDGPSLAQVLADGPLPPARVMDILAGAAAGLQAAHDAGLVHRDIKPANLLLTRDGTVKITDFGISYAAGSAPMTASGMLVGTAGYMAPERLGAGPVTGAADLYALGVVGYEALAGSPPFTGSPLEIAIAHRDQPLPPLPSSVPPGVAALIAALTAKDPAARPPSAGDVAQAATAQHDWLVGSTRADFAQAPGHGPTTRPFGDQAATVAAPPGPVTTPGGYGTTPGGYGNTPRSYDPYGNTPAAYDDGTPPRRRRMVLFAILAAVLVIAAVAIALVLTHGGGSAGPAARTSTQPSVTGAPTATGGAGQPTTGATTPAQQAPTTPAQQAPTTPPAVRTTAPPAATTPAAPPTSAAPTASAAATAAGTGNGNSGNGNGNSGNGDGNGTNGDGQTNGKGRG